jgi:hypothetical protein
MMQRVLSRVMLYSWNNPMRSETYSSSLVLFLYLQVLDVLTTLVGFSLGASEASPFISALTRWGLSPALWRLSCSQL